VSVLLRHAMDSPVQENEACILCKRELSSLALSDEQLVLMYLVLLAGLVAEISTSFYILVPRMCVLCHNFLVICRISLVSGD
jgi:hypothetical protein